MYTKEIIGYNEKKCMGKVMDYREGTPRHQLVLYSEALDSVISDVSAVRVMDAYVETLNLEALGFKIPEMQTGAPPYSPKLLLKIYTYGYFEKIRTSRKLENECKRNIELKWLTEDLSPDFKTIADFRKDNRNALHQVFKNFIQFCSKAGLLSLKNIGIDGTKIRAQNSQNNIYSRNEIDEVKKNIDEKISEYLTELNVNDEKEAEELCLKAGDEAKTVVSKLKKLYKYQNKVEGIQGLFENNPELQTYFANDVDSRFQSDKGKVRAGYNVQTAVDEKHKLIITNEVTNKSNDMEQMTPMIEKVQEVKKELNSIESTTVVMDAGYFNEKEIVKNIAREGIDIVVPDKRTVEEHRKNKRQDIEDKTPGKGFEVKDFKYDKDQDVCICPEGKILHKTHLIPGKERSGREVFEFQCKDCEGCKSRDKCTNNKRGRSIKISANHVIMENFKNDMKKDANKKIISKRKELVEHPFGTMKRHMGYTYFVQKGLEKVKAEFSFICFIYNFKRVINILGPDGILKVLQMNKIATMT
jgi:transposase